MMQPLVSVRLMTYNQEEFIGKALDSIMNQKTNFCFEVVVGDDFSSDRTMDILQSYKDTEKIKIRILKRKKEDEYHQKRKKYGRIYNFVDILMHCKGRYIAPIDGDDFWVSDEKLQRAVDVLEANDGISVVFTNSKECSRDGSFTGRHLTGPNFSKVSDIKALLRSNIATSGTVVYRRYNPKVLEPWIYDMDMADWPVNLVALKQGGLYYLNDVSSAYRVHDGGVWSSFSNLGKSYQILRSYRIMLENGLFDSCYQEAIEEYLRQLIRFLKLHDRANSNLKSQIKNEIDAVCSSLSMSWAKWIGVKIKIFRQGFKPYWAKQTAEGFEMRWAETVMIVNDELLTSK